MLDETSADSRHVRSLAGDQDSKTIVVLPSPYGPLALNVEQLRAGLARASELVVDESIHQDGDAAKITSVSRLVDAQEIAELFGVRVSWILQRAREDRIPHLRIGKYVRFDIEEVRRGFREIKADEPKTF